MCSLLDPKGSISECTCSASEEGVLEQGDSPCFLNQIPDVSTCEAIPAKLSESGETGGSAQKRAGGSSGSVCTPTMFLTPASIQLCFLTTPATDLLVAQGELSPWALGRAFPPG